MKPLEPNLDHEEVHQSAKKPTETNPKHTDKPDTPECEASKQEQGPKDIEPNDDELEEPEDDALVRTPTIDIIL